MQFADPEKIESTDSLDNKDQAPKKSNKSVEELVSLVMKIAEDKKAENVLALHVGPMLGVCDYFILATADNDRLMKAIVDEIERKLRKNYGLKPLSSEGRRDSNWVLLDYIDFVVHVFNASSRNEYRLESLWGDAAVIKPDSE